eukprot:jgi/Mesen1/3052/ME000018S02367
MVAMDITELFRKAVRSAAISSGYEEGKLSKVSAALIMRPSTSYSPFLMTAFEIFGNIRTMQAFILQHQKDYLDRRRSTESEKDNIEHEVALFVKACRQRIEVLKDSIGQEGDKAGGGLLTGFKRSNVHMVAHQHGVVLILSERLAGVTSAFDAMRGLRFQEVLQRAQPKRRRGLHPLSSSASRPEASGSATRQGVGQTGAAAEAQRGTLDDKARGGGAPLQQELVDDETRALQMELTELLETSREAESKMLDLAALNHMFSTHVLQQTRQIEELYVKAVEATTNISKGNVELRKTVAANRSNRTFLILFFFVASFALLFLDWYK